MQGKTQLQSDHISKYMVFFPLPPWKTCGPDYLQKESPNQVESSFKRRKKTLGPSGVYNSGEPAAAVYCRPQAEKSYRRPTGINQQIIIISVFKFMHYSLHYTL